MAIPRSTPAAVPNVTLSRIDAVPSPRFPRRFGARVFQYILTLAVVSSLVAVTVFYYRSASFIEAQLAHRATTLVQTLAAQAELGAYTGDPAPCETPLGEMAAAREVLFAAIYDRDGKEILHVSHSVDAMPPPDPDVLQRLRQMTAAEAVQGPFPAGAPADLQVEGYAPIVTIGGDPAASMAAPTGAPAVPRREVVGLARLGLSRALSLADQRAKMLQAGLILGAVILVMGLVAAFLISRRVARPIAALIQGAEALRAGDLEARVRIESRDELGQLAYAFNRMARRLNESISALEALNQDLEVEVERRTAEVQRAADFASLLNAPLGRRDILPDYEPAAAIVGGPAEGGLQRLLDQSLEALISMTGSSAAAAWLRVEEGEEGAPDALALQRFQDAPLPSFGEPPPTEFLEMNVPYVDAEERRLVAPLLLGTEVEGAVILLGAEGRDDVLRFVGQACSQLAIAVANVRAWAAADRLTAALTERNAALARQRDQLQEMNRLKSEFLANISHELRTPLNAIIGYCELIADGIYGDVNATQREALAGIDDSGKGLLALINQILDLAKVESGKMTVFVEEVDIDQLARAVVTEAAALARERPYKIGLFAGTHVKVRTDGAKVKQILTNLVSNAVKFTLEGHVDVKVRVEPDGGCTIAVVDTGIGIKPEDMKIIFEEFRQVDGSYTRQFGGTGLGLAIARRFAVLLGGSISVESALGVGSTFSLRLPKDPPSLAPRTTPGSLLATGRRHAVPDRESAT